MMTFLLTFACKCSFLVYLFAFILYFPMTKWRSFILFKINYYLLLILIIINYYLLLKTLEITNSSCKLNQKNIGRAPPPITSQPSNGERPVYRGIHFLPAAIDWTPGGHLTMAWWWPPGHRPKILAIRQENRAAAEQSPSGDRHVAAGWFTTLFKVKKIGRWATDLEKLAFGKKSSGHRGDLCFLGRWLKDNFASSDPILNVLWSICKKYIKVL